MKVKKGRPKLYLEIVEALPDYQCFSPASIAYFGLRHQLVKKPTPYIRDRTMIIRIRTTLARFAVKYMPAQGDGLVRIYGQGVGPGWFGWRWKQAYCLEIWPQAVPELPEGEREKVTSEENTSRPPDEVFPNDEDDEDDEDEDPELGLVHW